MTLDQIAALALNSESETLEFKKTTGTRREAAWTLCAFLNQRGGQVLFGSTERLEFEMPQCLLRIARFRGLDRMEFLDNRQFNGTPSRFSRTRSASCATPWPSPDDSSRTASSGSTNPYTRLWPRARRW